MIQNAIDLLAAPGEIVLVGELVGLIALRLVWIEVVELGVALVFGNGGSDEFVRGEGEALGLVLALLHLVVLVDVVLHLEGDFSWFPLNHI